jgi:hypothetical protein
MRDKYHWAARRTPAKRAVSWLILKLRVYLTGFLKHRNRPETAKKPRKTARLEHQVQAFTTLALTMPCRLAGFTLL